MIAGKEGDGESAGWAVFGAGDGGGGEESATAMFVQSAPASSCSVYDAQLRCVLQMS